MNTKSLYLVLALVAAPVAVFATDTTDRQIEEAAKATYNYRTVLEDNVKVKAKDGIVTLTGTVQDKDDKALAADTVENLPGVTAVKNDIIVKSEHAEKSDGWIALKIRGRLLVKGNVSAATTKVAVQDGVVTLTGTADNLAQKELTEAYAKDIDGVRSVHNEITVLDEAALALRDGVNNRQDNVNNRQDNVNVSNRQNNVNARQDNVNVNNRQDNVNANNRQDSATNRRNNDNLARDGNNNRRETMGEKMDDASITSQVKFALLGHKSTSALKTKVTTNDGVIVITGEAGSEAEKSLVTKLAGDVRGVRTVKNEMTVAKVLSKNN